LTTVRSNAAINDGGYIDRSNAAINDGSYIVRSNAAINDGSYICDLRPENGYLSSLRPDE